MLLYCSPILGPSDKYKYKWHQVISSEVSRTNRFWSIHGSHAPVAIAVFQLLPESSLPQITHCGRAPWLLHAFELVKRHWKLTSLDLQLVQAATFSPRCFMFWYVLVDPRPGSRIVTSNSFKISSTLKTCKSKNVGDGWHLTCRML